MFGKLSETITLLVLLAALGACQIPQCDRTKSGKPCQSWKGFGAYYEEIEGNSCTLKRHTEPWCYYDFPDGWEACADLCGSVTECWAENRVPVSNRYRALYWTIYNGTVNTGIGGSHCMPWRHAYTVNGHTPVIRVAEDDLDSDYCRVIDYDQPWCYTTRGIRHWEVCDIDRCNEGEKVPAQVCVGTYRHKHHWKQTNAGTDGDVTIRLRGTNGWSNTVFLNEPGRQDFEKGDCNCFKVDLTDVGQISEIDIRKCLKDKWRLTWVHVQYLNSQWRYRASYGRWFYCDQVSSTDIYRAERPSLAGKSTAELKSCSMNFEQFWEANRLGGD